MDSLVQDLRYAFRHLQRSPGFAVAAALTLAIGIGANTAMFTVLNTLMLQRLPITDPDGLIAITSRNTRGAQRPMPIMAVPELSREGPLTDVCGYNGGAVLGAEVDGVPTQTLVAFISGTCFTTFGVMPILGRPISDQDAPLATAGERVAVISHRFWTRMFAADPNVLGRTMRMEGVQMVVVGVLPEGFGGIQVDAGIDVFAPPDTIVPATSERRPVASQVLGRLRKGVTLEQATAEISARWPALIEAVAPNAQDTYEGADLYGSIPVFERMGTGVSRYRTQYGRPLTLILGLTSVLLLLTCINLGGLLLTRLMARRTELAMRLALGGSRRRIAQQMLLESLVLSCAGAVLALPLSFAFVAPLVSFIPPDLVEPTISFTPDWRVLGVTAAVALSVGVTMTALPLWIAMRRHATTQFTSDRTIAGTTNYLARGLLVGQVALSVVLLVGAGLLIRSLYLLQRTNLGIRTEGVLYAKVMPLPGAGQLADPGTHFPALLERLTALPGVRTAGLTRAFGQFTTEPITPVAFVGQEFGDLRAHPEWVSPGFFETLRIPLLAGRLLSWSDTGTTRRVAVVNESLARALAPDGNVLEHHIRWGTTRDFQDITIVGVVGNASFGNPRLTRVPAFYVTPLQAARFVNAMNVVVATDGDVSAVAAGVRQAVQHAGREYVHEAISLDDLIARMPASERMSATLAMVVAAVALLLALMGVHGTLAYSVARRTREIGVRVAIGAAPGRIATAMLAEALALTLAGVAIGIPVALVASRALETLMFGISSTDPMTFIGTIVLFLVMGIAAGILPARRAAAVDPIVALRAD